MSFEVFLIVAVGGLVVGVLSGMFGIGGGTMIVPLLNLVFGVPIAGAAATSLFVIAPTAVSGGIRHMQQKTADIRMGLLIGTAGAMTSAFGAWLSESAPSLVLVTLTAMVILYSASRMFKPISIPKVDAPPGEGKETDGVDAIDSASDIGAVVVTGTVGAPSANTNVAAPASGTTAPAAGTTAPAPSGLLTRQNIIAVVLGLFAGLIAGLVGVGGGFIIVPMTITLLGFSMHRAAGTSLLAIAIIAIPGIISHALLGHIWYLYGLALLVGTIPGAFLGARLAMHVPERALRLAFGVLLVFSGCMLIVNQLMS